MSALRFAAMPVLLIDCESTDGSREYFAKLMKTFEFDLLSAPLRQHGHSLDWLFANIPAQKVLLIDSDLEITNGDVIKFMKDYIDHENTFGCGFTHGPWPLKHHTDYLQYCYYQERMWIPITFLKTSYVRESLQSGHSFMNKLVYNEFYFFEPLSRQIFNMRMRFPRLWNFNPRVLKFFRKTYYGHKPHAIYYDTGADIYQHLKYQCNYSFVGLPDHFYGRYANHYLGVTRALLDTGQEQATQYTSIKDDVEERLRSSYGISFSS
jgi:glycosyltransferase involved in cell wall biosynthesis